MIRAVRTGLVVVLAAATAGCVDTPRTAGGLQLGVNDAPLRAPMRIDSGPPFQFPAGAWQEGLQGTTILRLLISQQGTVDSALVLDSSGHPSLDSAALAQALVLRFEPAAQGGDPVRVWGRLPVVFPRRDETESDADTP